MSLRQSSMPVVNPPHSFVQAPLNAQQLGGVVLDQLLGGERHLLKTLGVGGGNVGAGDTLGGGIKVVEAVLHGEGKNLSADTVHGVTGLDAKQAVGLLDGLDDGLDIEGLDGTQVDNLDLNTVVLLKSIGGGEGLANTARHGDHGQILTGALDLGLAEGKDEIILLGSLGHGEALAVHELVLEDDDGVGVADGGLEKTLGILSAPGRDNFETGNAAVPGRVVLRVLSTDTGSETVGATESDVARLDTAGHVEGLGGRVNNLVDGLHGEVESHELALARIMLAWF